MGRGFRFVGAPVLNFGVPVFLSAVLLSQVYGQMTINPTAPVNTSYSSGLDAETRLLLLNLHNELRREESQASNMNKLDWSPYLEQQAAKWVDGCEFKHQVNPPWGENLYRSTFKTTPGNTISNGLMAWQIEQFNIQSTVNGFDCCDGNKTTCCHYTQMIWAATEYIGCAVKQCDVLKGESAAFTYKDAWFLACYYYPPGNVIGQQPYQTGPSQCSACTLTNIDCDHGLCFFNVSRC